jgi:hypothetical protein
VSHRDPMGPAPRGLPCQESAPRRYGLPGYRSEAHDRDPCADIGFFAAGHGPVGTIATRARTMAAGSQLDPPRAEWSAMAWTVLEHRFGLA